MARKNLKKKGHRGAPSGKGADSSRPENVPKKELKKRLQDLEKAVFKKNE